MRRSWTWHPQAWQAHKGSAAVQFTSQVRLVIFDSVLDHIVRMDRVLRHSLRQSVNLKRKGYSVILWRRQPLGHLLLVGASGAGKTAAC